MNQYTFRVFQRSKIFMVFVVLIFVFVIVLKYSYYVLGNPIFRQNFLIFLSTLLLGRIVKNLEILQRSAAFEAVTFLRAQLLVFYSFSYKVRQIRVDCTYFLVVKSIQMFSYICFFFFKYMSLFLTLLLHFYLNVFDFASVLKFIQFISLTRNYARNLLYMQQFNNDQCVYHLKNLEMKQVVTVLVQMKLNTGNLRYILQHVLWYLKTDDSRQFKFSNSRQFEFLISSKFFFEFSNPVILVNSNFR
eukprot:TRINITY_DN1091_c0_g1_i1.p2 TRINITY_DN1091_c0_g1~~TRINITY_DN1091_c0_g1_i1.p2  ORF type:complete len:246 (-),score=-9.44 TRINITY_DN1091_c0_g1_i1:92-829(-)